MVLGGRSASRRLVSVCPPARSRSTRWNSSWSAGAVATSGLGTRVWRTETGFAHHLIDPATGRPAWTGVIQATALASSGVEAEMLAKMALLSGPELGLAVLEHAGGVLVLDDGEVAARREAARGGRGGRVSSSIDPGEHLWWLASRSFGVVAMVLVSLSVAFGLALSGRLLHGRGVAARMKTLHEALALSGLLAIVLHGVLLLPDPYLHPGLAGITIPFALRASPCGPRSASSPAGWPRS